MSWFVKRWLTPAPDIGPVSPVEIDLGSCDSLHAHLVVERLKGEGRHVQLYTRAELRRWSDWGHQRCCVLVAPEDESAVRDELTAAGFVL